MYRFLVWLILMYKLKNDQMFNVIFKSFFVMHLMHNNYCNELLTMPNRRWIKKKSRII